MAGARRRMGFGANAQPRQMAVGATGACPVAKTFEARTLAVLAPARMGGGRPAPPTAQRVGCRRGGRAATGPADRSRRRTAPRPARLCPSGGGGLCPTRRGRPAASGAGGGRSEEHPSEHQSLMRNAYAVLALTEIKTTRQSQDHHLATE